MGLLDDLIGNMRGPASGANQREDPLGSILGGPRTCVAAVNVISPPQQKPTF